MKNLSDLLPGESGSVESIGGEGAFKRRLIDMGITPGTIIKIIRLAPLGDPIQIQVRGYELSIHKSEAEKIIISSEQKINYWEVAIK